MSTTAESTDASRHELTTLPISELIERYPTLMQVFDAHGMDMCCGGGHTAPEAATLHGLELTSLLAELDAARLAR